MSLAEALPLAISLNPSNNQKADIYIDDTTTVLVDTGDNILKAEQVVVLAIEIIARQHSLEDHIPRDHTVSISNLLAEARLKETKCLLGWILNSRTLQVHLPEEKFIVWTKTSTKFYINLSQIMTNWIL